MKYVSIYPSDTLRTLTQRVGYQNVNQILADNNLTRAPNIGAQWKAHINEAAKSADPSYERKLSILNQFVDNADIYQEAALSDSRQWKVLDNTNAFPSYLYINDDIEDSIPDSYQIIGNNVAVSRDLQATVNEALLTDSVDPSMFRNVTATGIVGLSGGINSSKSSFNPMDWFNMPKSEVMIYSSLSGSALPIPAYPEELSDERVANFGQMPDLLYQYEPWNMYESSGPRSNSYTFDLHRDMWTGDHADGKANELIRFCQANCYPRYLGAAVVPSTVTLYISGSPIIRGIMTNVHVDWDGPLGKQDNYYLHFKLTLTITEVSADPLNYDSIMSKPLVG